MKDVIQLCITYKHEIVVLFKVGITYWLVISAIGAIPMPKDDDPHWKKIGFAVLNAFAGNLTRALVGGRDSIIALFKAIRGSHE